MCGSISGGHLNPAVTMSMCFCGYYPIIHTLAYVVAQILGAIFGSLLVARLLPVAAWGGPKGYTIGWEADMGPGCVGNLIAPKGPLAGDQIFGWEVRRGPPRAAQGPVGGGGHTGRRPPPVPRAGFGPAGWPYRTAATRCHEGVCRGHKPARAPPPRPHTDTHSLTLSLALPPSLSPQLLMTFVLIATVWSCGVAKPGHGSLTPIAVGFSLLACALAGGQWTGAQLNPARAIGPAVVFRCGRGAIGYYIAGELLAAFLAAMLFATVFGP
jgi:glycerol uptake facilitator-like aquaporin